jgi:hypothetical protein
MDWWHALLLLNVVLSYYLARVVGKHGTKQEDMTEKKPSEHIEDVVLLMAFASLVLFMFPQDLTVWLQLALPITVVIYGFASERPELKADLKNPTIGVKLLLALLVLVSLGAWTYTLFVQTEWSTRIEAVGALLAVVVAMGTYLGVSKNEVDEAKGESLHVHHSVIGLGLAILFASFTQNTIISQILFFVGLGMMINGLAIYYPARSIDAGKAPAPLTGSTTPAAPGAQKTLPIPTKPAILAPPAGSEVAGQKAMSGLPA